MPCRDCYFWIRPDNAESFLGPNQGQCTAEPPTPIPLVEQKSNKLIGGQVEVEIRVQMFRPVTEGHETCRHERPKLGRPALADLEAAIRDDLGATRVDLSENDTRTTVSGTVWYRDAPENFDAMVTKFLGMAYRDVDVTVAPEP